MPFSSLGACTSQFWAGSWLISPSANFYLHSGWLVLIHPCLSFSYVLEGSCSWLLWLWPFFNLQLSLLLYWRDAALHFTSPLHKFLWSFYCTFSLSFGPFHIFFLSFLIGGPHVNLMMCTVICVAWDHAEIPLLAVMLLERDLMLSQSLVVSFVSFCVFRAFCFTTAKNPLPIFYDISLTCS